MSNMSIEMTGPSSARISFSCDENGDHLTAGTSRQHTINITDGHFLRKIQGELYRLKSMEFEGHVAVKAGDGPRIKIDNSLWHDLADVLFAFVLNLDVSNLMENAEAA